MIAEALNHLTTLPFTAKEFRPYVRYSVSLWARANRCRADWKAHEDNSRAFIRHAIADMRQRRTAVVLGSGLVRDIPIADLAAHFDTVVLVDLVHLASVRLTLRRYRNIQFIERDVSGYDALADGCDNEPLAFLRQVPYLDLVISANLLSQIAIGAERRLQQEPDSRMPENALPLLIKAHLDGLAALPCRALLITDVRYKVIDRLGHTHEEVDMLHGIQPPETQSEWDWPVVPQGEESRDYKVLHKVIAHRYG